MIMNEEYFNLYDELYNLILKAYIDVYSLQEIDRYNEFVKNGSDALIKSSFNVMGHICELLKADLGLTIWKVYSDDNSKANTIKHLCQVLHQKSEAESLNLILPKLKLSVDLRPVEEQLSTLRKTFFAHNDATKAHVSVKLEDVTKLLDFLKDKLNALCFTEIDERTSRITDKTLNGIKFNVSLGLGLMINRSTFPVMKGKIE